MDVIFNCPKCEQELAVDSSGAGTEINCPACGEVIVIPQPESVISRLGAETDSAAPRLGPHPVNPIASSAAAKVEMHLRVPVHKTPTERLIEKPLAPIEVGHDRFDEIISSFLAKTGEANIISINTIAYSHLDIGTQKLLTDFGVMIVYKG